MSASDPETPERSNTPEPTLHRARTNLNAPGLETGVFEQGDKARRNFRRIANTALNKKPGRKENTYAYKNIDYDRQIRVLKIYRGRVGDALDCCLLASSLLNTDDLTYLPLSGHIPYIALSYHWGTDDAKYKVYLYASDDAYAKVKSWGPTARHGVRLELNSYILIQDNLKSALEALRSVDSDVCVWADALCINQSNGEERTAQVSRMHEVYSQADRVCIWLGGRRDAENQKTFDFLRSILNLERLDDFFKGVSNKEQKDLEDCKRVIDLMKSEWFTRRWIIQELALATDAYVRCGSCEMDWTEFGDSIALFMTKYDRIRRAFGAQSTTYSGSWDSDSHSLRALDARALGANLLVTATSNLFRRSNEGKILQRLISLEVLVSSMLLPFEAKDPKDTIFAVLHIAKDTYKPGSSTEHGHPVQTVIKILGRCLILIPVLVATWKSSTFAGIVGVLVGPTRVKNSTVDVQLIGKSPDDSNNLLLNSFISTLIQVIFLIICVMSTDIVIKRGILPFISPPASSRGISTKITKPIDKRIEPNYDKCLMDVFSDFMEYCVEYSNSLDILCRHWAPLRERDPKPSWILSVEGHAFGGPRNNVKARRNGDSFVGGSERRRHYRASGSRTPDCRFEKTRAVKGNVTKRIKQEPGRYTEPITKQSELPARFTGKLEVKGFVLDEIDQYAAVLDGVISRKALEICGWSKENGTTDIDQVWRTLVADRGPDGTNPHNWYRRACRSCLEWYNNQPDDFFNTSYLKSLNNTPSAKIEFLDRVQQVTWGRKVIRSTGNTGNTRSRHFVGLAPSEARVGDLISILFGCSVPVILRRRKTGGEFTFIGECYIDGVMDGEAIDAMPSGSKEQWFGLR
ncbi:hypothetical protein BP5796_12616 [Coleophoma crateriformis]|uniref:Heterokaryon incompatibility domain-containing protein n=1 Tax=Coleophoma crateriformis TaxID=565419 RepID=A0A3D8Q7J9_9HELO|nr:hypothetical protein BP5796_12616 [Coleophoma crateriformis]